jgi:bis(5'-nucleosyl)-tetraphosphatase (symmetrical)
MSTYVIGDIQGCFTTLKRLLERVRFDPPRDTLWLVGDIVNRGPASADVLRWAYAMRKHVRMVLGNHDLRLLAMAQGDGTSRPGDTLEDILQACDLKPALSWLRSQPVFAVTPQAALVHAGLHPSWSIDEALALNHEVQSALAGDGPCALLRAWMQHSAPQWEPSLTGMPRLCSILRVMTTIRVCQPHGEVLWRFAQPPQAAPPGYLPWFAIDARRSRGTTIACGHWAALGLHTSDNVRALDTGCVWGKSLTAWRMEDDVIFAEPAQDGAALGD